MAKLKKLEKNTTRELEKNTLKLTLLRSSDMWYAAQKQEHFDRGSDYIVRFCDEPMKHFLPELNEARNGQMFEIEITLTNNEIREVERVKKTK